MSQNTPLSFTTPIGRIINGNPHDGHTTDHQGNPLVVKSGPNAGQPRTEYRFGVAVPKTPGVTDFKQEPWAQTLKQAAQQGYPQMFDPQGNPLNPQMAFAWKVMDGDSQIPNSMGNKPCDMEGAAGNWVIWMSNGFAPKLYDWNAQQGTALPLNPDDRIECGYYVEVYCTVGANGAVGNQAGIFINPTMVCRRAYGEVIVNGPSVSAAGFGGGALPQGASTMPVGASTAQTPPPAQQQQQTLPPVTPAHDLAQGPGADVPPPVLDDATPPPVMEDPILVYGGKEKPRSAWLAMPGWNEALVNQHCLPKA